ncbi:hypothetical protein [Pelagibacterium lentulum]|uniref:Uncharacterized protein n=1 Tax=Pelagibacterium lentulum TaxID=2029865 RepID=A0A916RIE9_9HYPH|nr:hypothetical protein [Pelagibacterium lentulum]GGA57386.1 hypothetical protein GCM10011499_29560 [Pelagibacterium lentulum]
MSLFLLPAAISLLFVVLHYLSGGPEVVRPLLKSRELPSEVVYVLYLCWHVVTMIMAAFVVAYAGAAFEPSFRAYAVAATVFAGAMTVWSLIVVIWKRQSHQKMPQWVAFLFLGSKPNQLIE